MSEPIDWKALTPEQRNRLVAEKVMGWTEQQCDLDAHPEMELTIYSDGSACCPRCEVYDHIGNLEHGSIPPPPYSTSMDAVWEIVKHFDECLERDERTYTLFSESFLSGIATSYDKYSDHYCSDEAIFSLSDLAEFTPEKICLAALRAVEVDINA